MASITGTVSSVALNTTTLTANQKKMLEPAAPAAGAPAAQAQNKPLSIGVGRAIDGFTCRPPSQTVSATQARQLHSIADGVRKGTLTGKEAETLLKSQQDVFTASKNAMADGKLSVQEKTSLAAMQQNAQKQIDAALQGGGRSLGSVFGLNKDGQQQAAQLHKLADGISRGTITQAETGHLLGQQVAIADARGDSDTKAEKSDVSAQLARAGKELDTHSKPGTQIDKFRMVGARVARG